MNNRHAELIHRSIDGELTQPEREELAQCLAESASARAFHEKMVLLKRLSEEQETVPAPPEIKHSVMAHVRRAHAPAVRESGTWGEVLQAFRTILTPRVAYGVAAGVLIGFAVGAMTMRAGSGTTGRPDSIHFSGTLGLPSTAGGLRHVDSDFRMENGLTVHLITDRSDEHVLVRANVESQAKATMTLSYDPEHLEFQALENDEASLDGATVGQGKIELSQMGTSTFVILFRVTDPQPQSIVCHAEMKDQRYQHEIALSSHPD